jgi:hypothetical protein
MQGGMLKNKKLWQSQSQTKCIIKINSQKKKTFMQQD